MTKDLYTTSDVKKVRQELIREQGEVCALTGLAVDDNQWVLDHNHDENQFVRGALHRQSNVMLGKIENAAKRYLYWYPYGLPDFLRLTADYLDQGDDTRFRHPGWIRKLLTAFRKLNESQKKKLLQSMGLSEGKNATERIDLFKKAVMNKAFTRDEILDKMKGV